MNYVVVSEFYDGGLFYKKGSPYPMNGVEITEERIQYLSDKELNGKAAFIRIANDELDAKQFKGVKETSLRKALENAGIQISDEYDRNTLIQLMIDNELAL
ncbi:hypothetical protein [Enterococcus sp.]|uniref:hypothetical protein n=1 Tax=Enterococcus sp. TaxID=35783 RepID=UPI00289CA8AF|nr:hypothetical protein [Enterococcus sp.]